MYKSDLQGRKERQAEWVSHHMHLLGQIAWLWTNSPLHKEWPVALLGINGIPAVYHSQYMLITQDNLPVAYCSWAYLSLEAEKKYLADVNSLTLADWISGDRMWLIDWVAPFGHSFALYEKMRAQFPQAFARAIRVDRDKKTARVQEIFGKKVNKKVAREKLDSYFLEMTEALKREHTNQ